MKTDEPCFCFCFDGMTSQKVGSKQSNLLVSMNAVNMSAILLFASRCIWLSSHQDKLRVEFFTGAQDCAVAVFGITCRLRTRITKSYEQLEN